MSGQSGALRIAISGGGLAGATLIHALQGCSDLDVHIFDAAPAFSTSGAAIGVTRNALQALDLIGPSATAALERAGAVPQQGVRFLMAQGKVDNVGKLIDEVDSVGEGKRLTSIVHRAAFLGEILKDVDPDHMHVSKKLIQIQETQKSITLLFSDNTSHECDILVGADGIHSYIRKHILGDDAAANPVPTPFWILLTLHPLDKAQACLGEDMVNPQDAREWSWLGDGAYILHNVLSGGEQVQFAIAIRSESENPSTTSEDWRKTISAADIDAAFKGFPPHLHKAVQELVCNQPSQTGLILWEHLPARTYAEGPVCMIGDAAHATTPWQASGGGMSIEDALILSSLLGNSSSRAEALASLRIFDRLRRPRTQAIVESSRATGMVLTGGDPEMGLDFERLKGRLVSRWDFILDFDLEEQRDEALRLLEAERREMNSRLK